MEKEVVATLNDYINTLENPFNDVLVDTDKMTFAQEAHFAFQVLSDPKNAFLLGVAKKNTNSLRNAIINVAAVGLTLNPVSQYAYLIPRKGAIYLDISYKGLIKTATDSGSIFWAQAEVVYENDEFTFTGVGEKPVHKYNPFSKERGAKIGAYVVVKTFEGDFLSLAMSIEEVFEIRNKSEAFMRNSGPWVTFENEMIKKTVIKRASKTWPRTSKIERLEKAIDVVNEHEGINFHDEDFGDIDEDFPRKEEDMVLGPNYLVIKGKYRNLRLSEICFEDLEDYFDFLKKGRQSNKYTNNLWVETYNHIEDFITNYATYRDTQAELENEM